MSHLFTIVRQSRRRSAYGIAMLGLAVLATALYTKMTQIAVAITPDSISYLATAAGIDNPANPKLVQSVQTHFGPLFSATLSTFGSTPSEMLAGVKWLHLALLLTTMCLCAVASLRSGGNAYTALACAGLVGTCSPLISVYGSCLSEPLFTVVVMAGCVLFVEYILYSRMWALCGAGVLLGVAGLVRYAGAAFVLISCGIVAGAV